MTCLQFIEKVQKIFDEASRKLSAEDYRTMLEELESDARIRIDCLDEDEGEGE